MTTATTDKKLYDICQKAKGISKCEGCSKIFCYNHFGDHRQELNQQLDEVEVTCDLFRQTLNPSPFCPIVVSPCKIKINDNTRWLQDGITITGGNQRGNELSQLDGPWGICVDDDEQTIYIADTFNHRIIEWKYGATHGQVMAGGNGPGKRIDQLYEPTDLAVDKEKDCFIICDRGNRRVVRWPRRNGTCGQTVISDVQCYGLTKDHDKYFYIADHERHEIRRWRIGDTCETVVAGGHGEGNRLDQLDSPGYIFVDKDYSVYISDEKNHRVMKWIKGATEGIVVAGGQGKGNGLAQLSGPREVLADQLGTVYVTDCGNHRVMLWSKGAT
ncbi:unnamed protein product [Rotaria sp. Silwood2]|nr:unnamed protein product [Rotaria sp. Silwood2]CAF4202370.1 unnamed protein product [Rotaria sp. Silwood2]